MPVLAALALAAATITAGASRGWAQSFVLDPLSATLPAIPATSGDILMPSAAPPAAPPPDVGLTAANLGLLPGDVIDAISFFDDASPGGTLYFSVDRASTGAGVVAPPDVSSEVVSVPPATQPEAASDIFSSFDPNCPGINNQILDGNGAPLGPPSCYGGFGMGLTELLPTPPPPFNDDVSAFDWGFPGRGRLFCIIFSLAPGSPTLIPGTNPAFPAGAEPGDILYSCPGSFAAMYIPASSMGLVSGGPGCAPPACDDVDALTSWPLFSLSPASPSVPAFSPADVLSFGPGVVYAAAALGLLPTDNVNALEQLFNPCPAGSPPLVTDPIDVDGVGGCDNCPAAFNPGQEDTDGDGTGDACDTCTDAADGDGFGSPGFPANTCPLDVCPTTFDPGQADGDLDGAGDACDNCPGLPNPSQADGDFDGLGDACDGCPADFNPGQQDTDGDGTQNSCDTCPTISNPAQTDADGDGTGNECDVCPGFDDGDFANPCRKLYSVSRDDDQLRMISPVDGATIGVVTMTAAATIFEAHGLATDPTSGDLYALLETSDPGARRLVTIDPPTGTVTDIGDTGDFFSGLAIDCAGTIYGVTGDGANTPETLYTLSKTDATPTLFVTLGNGDNGETIAINPADGLIYHASGNGTPNVDQIFETVDPSDMSVTNIPLSGVYGGLPALTYDEVAANFVGGDRDDAFLFRITAGGAVTLVGQLDHNSNGLAFSDAFAACGGCPAAPLGGCTVGFAKGLLMAKDSVAGKEKLAVKLLKGPEILQADLGDPTVASGTEYRLCIYNDTPALVAQLVLDRAGDTNCSGGSNTCWKSVGGTAPNGRGYKYKDGALASDGFLKWNLKGGTGSAGKSKVIIKGKGPNLAPFGIPAGLTGSASAKVQIIADDAPAPGCFELDLIDLKADKPGLFKIKK